MTVISNRISKGLVIIDGMRCSIAVARKPSTCALSGKSIKRGDVIYKPLFNDIDRHKRWLASEIDKLESKPLVETR